LGHRSKNQNAFCNGVSSELKKKRVDHWCEVATKEKKNWGTKALDFKNARAPNQLFGRKSIKEDRETDWNPIWGGGGGEDLKREDSKKPG